MKLPMYDPMQNLLPVPSLIILIAVLCSPPSPIGDNQSPLHWQWAQDQAPQPEGRSDFIDSSGPIFSMYMEMAEEEDKKMTESWKADAEGILVFVRLYLLVPCLTLSHWP